MPLVLIGMAIFVAAQQADAQDEIGTSHWNLSEQGFQLLDDELSYYLYSDSDFRAMLEQPSSSPASQTQALAEVDSGVALAAYETDVDLEKANPLAGVLDSTGNVVMDDLLSNDLLPDDLLPDDLLPPMEILSFEWPAVPHGRSILASNTIEELQAVVDQERISVEEDTHNTESQRVARLQQLSAADEWLQKANQYQRRIQLYGQQTAESNQVSEEKRRLLSEPIQPDEPALGEIDSPQLYRELQDKRAQLATQKVEFDKYTQAIKTLGDRITEIPRERAEATARLEQIQDAIDHNEDTDNELLVNSESNSEIRLLLQYARKRATELELKMLDAEVEQQEVAGLMLPLERDIASRAIAKLETEIEAWKLAARDTRKAEDRREAGMAREASMNAHPNLRDWASRNEQLVQERSQLYDNLKKLESEINTTRDQFDSVVAQVQSVQGKIEAAGLTNESGMLLVNMRRTLLSPGESHMRIHEVQEEMKKVNLQVVALTEEREQLTQPQKLIETEIGISTDEPELFQMANGFIDAKRSYLDQLLTDYRIYRGLLADANVERRKLVDELHATTKYINENALWIRSTSAINLADFTEAGEAARFFVEPEKWNGLLGAALEKGNSKPMGTAVVGVGLFLLFVFNVKLKSSLKRRLG